MWLLGRECTDRCIRDNICDTVSVWPSNHLHDKCITSSSDINCPEVRKRSRFKIVPCLVLRKLSRRRMKVCHGSGFVFRSCRCRSLSDCLIRHSYPRIPLSRYYSCNTMNNHRHEDWCSAHRYLNKGLIYLMSRIYGTWCNNTVGSTGKCKPLCHYIIEKIMREIHALWRPAVNCMLLDWIKRKLRW